MIRKRLFVGFLENINDWSNRGNMFQRLANDDSLLIIRDTDKVVISPNIQTQIDINDKIQVATIDDDLGKEFCKWVAAKISSQSELTTIIFFLGIDAIDERRGTNYREELSKRISKAYEIRNAPRFSKINRVNEQIVGVDELKNRRKEQMDRAYPRKVFSEFNSENTNAQDSLEIEELFDGDSQNASASKAEQAKIIQNYLQSQSTKSKSKKKTYFSKQNDEQQKSVTSKNQSNDESTGGEKTDTDSESKHINSTDERNQEQIVTQSSNDENADSQDPEKSKDISEDTVKLPSQDELNRAAREREERERQIAKKKDLEIQTLEKKILNQDLFEEEISKTTSNLDDSKAEVVYYTAIEFIQEAEALYPKQITSLKLSEDLEKAFVFISQLSKTTNTENFKNSWKSYSGGIEIILDEPAFQYLKRKADEFLFLCDALFR